MDEDSKNRKLRYVKHLIEMPGSFDFTIRGKPNEKLIWNSKNARKAGREIYSALTKSMAYLTFEEVERQTVINFLAENFSQTTLEDITDNLDLSCLLNGEDGYHLNEARKYFYDSIELSKEINFKREVENLKQDFEYYMKNQDN